MYRFFEDRNYDNINELNKENLHHLKNVIRIKDDEDFSVVFNDKIILFNLKDDMLIYKKEIFDSNEPPIKLSLFFGILKGDKNEKVIEHGTEVGVYDFYPLIMDRCVSNISDKVDKKIQRWQKIAKSAAGQSKRDIVPLVHRPIKVDEIAKNYSGDLILFYEDERNLFFKDIKEKLSKNLAIIVGPEGGISKREIEVLKDAHRISLGKRILRAETSSVVGAFYIIHNMECD